MTLLGDKLILRYYFKNMNSFASSRKPQRNTTQSVNTPAEPKTLNDISGDVAHSDYNAEDYLFLKHRITVMSSIDESNERDSK